MNSSQPILIQKIIDWITNLRIARNQLHPTLLLSHPGLEPAMAELQEICKKK
jgi:hypothetical protein